MNRHSTARIIMKFFASSLLAVALLASPRLVHAEGSAASFAPRLTAIISPDEAIVGSGPRYYGVKSTEGAFIYAEFVRTRSTVQKSLREMASQIIFHVYIPRRAITRGLECESMHMHVSVLNFPAPAWDQIAGQLETELSFAGNTPTPDFCHFSGSNGTAIDVHAMQQNRETKYQQSMRISLADNVYYGGAKFLHADGDVVSNSDFRFTLADVPENGPHVFGLVSGKSN